MSTNRTFGNSTPAYFLGRPREVYEARYATRAQVAQLRNAYRFVTPTTLAA